MFHYLTCHLNVIKKIIIFKTADALIIGDIKKFNSPNPGFLIFIIIYMIFGRFSNFLYSCIGSQSYKDLQIYSNTLGVTIANNAKVSILGNVSFKCFIQPYFFQKSFQLQIKCFLSTTIYAS